MSINIKELIKAHKGVRREVYLDSENSSQVPMEVVKAMAPYFSEKAYGNPTITHKPGWMAYEEIMKSNFLFITSAGSPPSKSYS